MSAKIAIEEANIHQKMSKQTLHQLLKNNCHKTQNNKKFFQDYITGEGFKIFTRWTTSCYFF